MKYLNRLLTISMLALLFTACEKDNTVIDSEVSTPDLTEYTESNPLINRGSGGDDGLLLDCITILFPFDLIADDGSITTFASIEDFETFDPVTTIYVDFSYPLTISIDEVESTVESGEELGELFASCVPSGGWEEGDFPAYDITFDNSCYVLNYPIQLINMADEIITIESEVELIDALTLDAYYFVFPFDMTRDDGVVVTVNNMDEIFEALIDCNDFYGDEDVEWESDFAIFGCYLFTFPFDVLTDDGEIITVNDEFELTDLILVGVIVDFSYPISLLNEDGEIVTANSTEEVQALLDECEGMDNGGGGFEPVDRDLFDLWVGTYFDAFPSGIPCYEIDFPITFTNTDDNTELTINNQEEYDAQFLNEFPNLGSYLGVFPMTVTYTLSGEEFIINASEDIETLLSGCE